MKSRIDAGKPLSLNDQMRAISLGLLTSPQSSLWPTPDVRGFTNAGSLGMLKKMAASEEEYSGMAYRASSKKKLLPTPRCNFAPSTDKKHLSIDGFVKLFPTPTAGDNAARGPNARNSRGEPKLSAIAIRSSGGTGQLNPDWVEALMGYPIGWTDTSVDEPETTDIRAAWLDGTWEDGIPRTTHVKKNRAKRLHGLGNAVVPQIPQLLMSLIVRALW